MRYKAFLGALAAGLLFLTGCASEKVFVERSTYVEKIGRGPAAAAESSPAPKIEIPRFSAMRSPNSIYSQLGIRGVTDQIYGTNASLYAGYLVKLGPTGEFDVSVLPSSLTPTVWNKVLYIDGTNGNDDTNYTGTVSNPYKTFTNALAHAEDETVFVFAPGTYAGTTVTDTNIYDITLVGLDPTNTYFSSTIRFNNDLGGPKSANRIDLYRINVSTIRQQQYHHLNVHLYDRAIVGNIERQYPSAVNSHLTVERDPSITLSTPITGVTNSTEILSHNAEDMVYDASVAADWWTNVFGATPTTIEGALDSLASRALIVEGTNVGQMAYWNGTNWNLVATGRVDQVLYGGPVPFWDEIDITFTNGVPGNFVPDLDGVYSLGSSTQQWLNLWLSGTVMIDGTNIFDLLTLEQVLSAGNVATNTITAGGFRTEVTNVIDQVEPAGAIYALGGPVSSWQSFTPARSGVLTNIVFASAGSSWTPTLKVYSGQGTGGTELYSAVHSNWSGPLTYVSFTCNVPVVAENTYTFYISAHAPVNNDPGTYTRGRSNITPTQDIPFTTYMRIGQNVAPTGGVLTLDTFYVTGDVYFDATNTFYLGGVDIHDIFGALNATNYWSNTNTFEKDIICQGLIDAQDMTMEVDASNDTQVVNLRTLSNYVGSAGGITLHGQGVWLSTTSTVYYGTIFDHEPYPVCTLGEIAAQPYKIQIVGSGKAGFEFVLWTTNNVIATNASGTTIYWHSGDGGIGPGGQVYSTESGGLTNELWVTNGDYTNQMGQYVSSPPATAPAGVTNDGINVYWNAATSTIYYINSGLGITNECGTYYTPGIPGDPYTAVGDADSFLVDWQSNTSTVYVVSPNLEYQNLIGTYVSAP